VATKFQDSNKDLISEIIRGRDSSFLTTDYIF
jgi:glyceraldehyde-3-phosphate dehydrogenase (NADP+)